MRELIETSFIRTTLQLVLFFKWEFHVKEKHVRFWQLFRQVLQGDPLRKCYQAYTMLHSMSLDFDGLYEALGRPRSYV